MGVFPWAFFFHLLLLVIDIKWLLGDNVRNQLVNAHLQVLYSRFLKADPIDPWEPDRNHVFTNLDEMRTYIDETVNWVHNLRSLNLENSLGNEALIVQLCQYEFLDTIDTTDPHDADESFFAEYKVPSLQCPDKAISYPVSIQFDLHIRDEESTLFLLEKYKDVNLYDGGNSVDFLIRENGTNIYHKENYEDFQNLVINSKSFRIKYSLLSKEPKEIQTTFERKTITLYYDVVQTFNFDGNSRCTLTVDFVIRSDSDASNWWDRVLNNFLAFLIFFISLILLYL